jgi:hypothetical protein
MLIYHIIPYFLFNAVSSIVLPSAAIRLTLARFYGNHTLNTGVLSFASLFSDANQHHLKLMVIESITIPGCLALSIIVIQSSLVPSIHLVTLLFASYSMKS